eukprot:TRINITY_DN9473_c0_g2_i1.p1 TRINITY_DN9473_c0_g2~~TRINITY_DN9473_c0_g2_i1.p1  ORF type:complete len:337 (-),score=51.17 TRINITY_DN9473_c0_g2_i1:58-1068(-)
MSWSGRAVATTTLIVWFGGFALLWVEIFVPWKFYWREEIWEKVLAWIALAAVHIFSGILLISYLVSIFRDPGYIPIPWDSTVMERRAERRGDNLDIEFGIDSTPLNKTKRNEITYCFRCEIQRPPQSHHCRICGRCVAFMDHHCPYINNCVGKENIKAFSLVMIYGAITASLYTLFFTARLLYKIAHNEIASIPSIFLLAGDVAFLFFLLTTTTIGYYTFKSMIIGKTQIDLYVSIRLNDERNKSADIIRDRFDDEIFYALDSLESSPPKKNARTKSKKIILARLRQKQHYYSKQRDDVREFARQNARRELRRQSSKLANFRFYMGQRWMLWWLPF